MGIQWSHNGLRNLHTIDMQSYLPSTPKRLFFEKGKEGKKYWLANKSNVLLRIWLVNQITGCADECPLTRDLPTPVGRHTNSSLPANSLSFFMGKQGSIYSNNYLMCLVLRALDVARHADRNTDTSALYNFPATLLGAVSTCN